jgi:hypothetical protein
MPGSLSPPRATFAGTTWPNRAGEFGYRPSVISFALQPHIWLDWLAYLPGYGDTTGWPFPISIWPRLPLAIVLVLWGARSDRQWMAVLGAILVWPRLYFLSIALLVALLPPLSHAPVTTRIRRILGRTPRVQVVGPRSNG